jgi:hypothetical protein
MGRQREEIFEERRRLLRGNRFLKDDVHRAADKVIENAALHVQDALSRHTQTLLTQQVPNRRTEPGGELLDLAALWALTQPQFVKMIHAAIEAAPAPDIEHEWSPFTRAELDKKVAALDAELAETEREDRRAPLLAERDRVNEQLAALGKD